MVVQMVKENNSKESKSFVVETIQNIFLDKEGKGLNGNLTLSILLAALWALGFYMLFAKDYNGSVYFVILYILIFPIVAGCCIYRFIISLTISEQKKSIRQCETCIEFQSKAPLGFFDIIGLEDLTMLEEQIGNRKDAKHQEVYIYTTDSELSDREKRIIKINKQRGVKYWIIHLAEKLSADIEEYYDDGNRIFVGRKAGAHIIDSKLSKNTGFDVVLYYDEARNHVEGYFCVCFTAQNCKERTDICEPTCILNDEHVFYKAIKPDMAKRLYEKIKFLPKARSAN